MTKELTPLEALHKLYWDKAVNNEYGYNGRSRENNEKFRQECKELNDIIEKSLKEYEEYKTQDIKMSDGLETLYLYRNDFFSNDFSIIEQELKALEIIREKNVQVDTLLYMIQISTKPREDYNINAEFWLGDREIKQLTQEEYELLKEVLL